MTTNPRRGPDGRGSTGTGSSKAGSQPVSLAQFMAGLRQVENGGSYNWSPNSAGARGAYQILSSNWPSWAAAAGVDPSDHSPAAQDKVAAHQLEAYYKHYNGDWSMVAAAWFGGEGGAAKWAAGESDPSDGNMNTTSYVNAVLKAAGMPAARAESDTAAGGSATAAPTTTVNDQGTQLPPDPTPAEVDSYIEANYGYLAAFLKDPSVAPLLRYAARKQLNPDEIRGLLTDTSPTAQFPKAVAWYEKTSQTARQFEADAINDPATHEQQIAQARADLAREAQQLGIPVAGGRLQQLAADSLKYGWDTGQAQAALAAEFHYNPSTNYGGTAGQSIDALRARAEGDFVVPISDHTLGLWTQQILAGTKTSADFDTYLRQQALSLYPTLKKPLEEGETTAQYLDSYMQAAENILERPFTPGDFLNNPRYSKALNTTLPDGSRAPMSLSDWQTYLRGLPEYQTTSGARQQGADMALKIAQTFGKVAS